VVNEKLRCFIVPADGALVQDASWLMRAPVGIEVGSTLQQERRNLKMPVYASSDVVSCPNACQNSELVRIVSMYERQLTLS
jgi:hypothetical protein